MELSAMSKGDRSNSGQVIVEKRYNCVRYRGSSARSRRMFRFMVVVSWFVGCLLTVPSIECMFTIPPQAAQMAELYWMALTRDVPFSKYGEDEATVAAAGTPTTFCIQLAEWCNRRQFAVRQELSTFVTNAEFQFRSRKVQKLSHDCLSS